MTERVLPKINSKRAVDGVNTAVIYVRKTLPSLRKKTEKVSRTARLSRKDVIEWTEKRSIWVVSRKICLSSHIGTKGIFYCFSPHITLNKYVN